jgi:hypothetical protein
VSDPTDCDDLRADIHPAATELCDALDTDEDCDGLADDADDTADATTASTWYADLDGDGFGDPAAPLLACDLPAAAAAGASDCDDSDGAVFPGATEVCNGVDDNCDSTLDPSSPPSCVNTGSLSLSEGGGLYPITASGFVLYDEDTWATTDALITALGTKMTPVTLTDVMGNLNRDGDPVSASTMSRATGFVWGFDWNSDDNTSSVWWPQGVSGSFDADPSGLKDGFDIVLVSLWMTLTRRAGASAPCFSRKKTRIASTARRDLRSAYVSRKATRMCIVALITAGGSSKEGKRRGEKGREGKREGKGGKGREGREIRTKIGKEK